MSFDEQPWRVRYAAMGDQAETIFESVVGHILGKVARVGWRRPNISMRRMSDVLRYTPDYFCDAGYLVEVMGCGRDHVLKLKTEKYEALKKWNEFLDDNEVALFAWNSADREYVLLNWDNIKRLVARARNRGIEEFNDGKSYYPCEWDDCTELVSFVGAWED